MRDIIITLPKTKKWEDYNKELQAVKEGAVLNFKVSNLPKETAVGAKCWLVHNGLLKGYMIICGLSTKGFTCGVTGTEWSGNFIQRSGNFIYIKGIIPYKGFQGYRYFDINEFLKGLHNK